jgi:hypothetical protein
MRDHRAAFEANIEPERLPDQAVEAFGPRDTRAPRSEVDELRLSTSPPE